MVARLPSGPRPRTTTRDMHLVFSRGDRELPNRRLMAYSNRKTEEHMSNPKAPSEPGVALGLLVAAVAPVPSGTAPVLCLVCDGLRDSFTAAQSCSRCRYSLVPTAKLWTSLHRICHIAAPRRIVRTRRYLARCSGPVSLPIGPKT